jgi:hypothetical protein
MIPGSLNSIKKTSDSCNRESNSNRRGTVPIGYRSDWHMRDGIHAIKLKIR